MYSERGRSRPVHLRVETASGVVIDRVSKWWDDLAEIVGVGASDLNDDGKPEFWINDRAGATAHHVGLVVFDKCTPKEVIGPQNYVAGFQYAATGMSFGSVGVECADVDDDGTVEIVEWETVDHRDVYPESARDGDAWSYVAYRLAGTRVRVVARRGGTDLDRRPSFLKWADGVVVCDGVEHSF